MLPISELMLPILTQRYNKNHFIFDTVLEWETNWNFTGCQMPHFMTVLIFFKPFFDNKMSFFFQEYGAFKETGYT